MRTNHPYENQDANETLWRLQLALPGILSELSHRQCCELESNAYAWAEKYWPSDLRHIEQAAQDLLAEFDNPTSEHAEIHARFFGYLMAGVSLGYRAAIDAQ